MLWVAIGIGVLAVVLDIIALWRNYQTKKEFQMLVREGFKADWALLIGDNPDPLNVTVVRALQKMYNTFVAKNHDYGTDNLSRGWLLGIVLRISDKFSRLWTLVGPKSITKPKVADEKLSDTFLDLANYGVVGFLMANNQWPRSPVGYGPEFLATMMAEILGVLPLEQRLEIDDRLVDLAMSDEFLLSVLNEDSPL